MFECGVGLCLSAGRATADTAAEDGLYLAHPHGGQCRAMTVLGASSSGRRAAAFAYHSPIRSSPLVRRHFGADDTLWCSGEDSAELRDSVQKFGHQPTKHHKKDGAHCGYRPNPDRSDNAERAARDARAPSRTRSNDPRGERGPLRKIGRPDRLRSVARSQARAPRLPRGPDVRVGDRSAHRGYPSGLCPATAGRR